jgi:NNP family nitrate/nitrite transporter-like MFS transporter
MLTLFYFVSFGGFIALTVWLPTYWTELHGMPLVAAGLLTALYSLSASLLRVLGGWFADRAGGERVVLIGFLLLGAGALLMSLAGTSAGPAVAGMLMLALGMGFANAAVFKLVPRYSPAAVGGAAGIVGGLGAFGGFAIPPLMALFVTRSASAGYAQGFWVFVLFAVLCLLGLARLRRAAA